MNEINNIRGAIKSLKNGKSAFFPIEKRKIIHNYSSDLKITENMLFKVETVKRGNKKAVKVTRL